MTAGLSVGLVMTRTSPPLCPGVVQTAKEHSLNHQEGTASQYDQVKPDNAGHLVLVLPVVTKEARVLF